MNFLSNTLIKLTHYHDHTLFDREVVSIFESGSPCVIVSTHTSSLDGAFLNYILNKYGYIRNVYFLTKIEVFKNKVLSYILKKNKYIPLDRNSPQKDTLNICNEILNGGNIIALSPVGKRTDNYDGITIKRGGVHIAYKAQVPLIPIAIAGAMKLKFFHIFKRQVLSVYFGKPIFLKRNITNPKELKQYEETINIEILKQLSELHSFAINSKQETEINPDIMYSSNIFSEFFKYLLSITIGRWLKVMN